MRCLLQLELWHVCAAQHLPVKSDLCSSDFCILSARCVDMSPQLELPPNRSSLKFLVFYAFCVWIQLLSSADCNPSEAPLCACLC